MQPKMIILISLLIFKLKFKTKCLNRYKKEKNFVFFFKCEKEKTLADEIWLSDFIFL